MEYCCAFKQAKRRDDDIAIANCGLRVRLSEKDFVVEDACFSFGGMGATTISATKTVSFFIGKKWDISLVDQACGLLLNDLPLTATSPGGQIQYRKTLCQSFLFKFGISFTNWLCAKHSFDYKMNDRDLSCVSEIKRGISFGKQIFEETGNVNSAVGKAIKHVSADKQVTGEALYVDDIPLLHNEFYAAILGSSICHGFIKKVDISLAINSPGYKGFVSAEDIDNVDFNMIGPVFKDEELFATKEVHFIGQIIGLILASTETEAKAAMKLCKVTYEPLPFVLTIEDAIEQKSFFSHVRKLERGDFSDKKLNAVENGLRLQDAVKHVEGVARMSGQEHFYLETNVSIAIPGEDDEMELIASTQHPTGIIII
jgi:xanthine dehydrogenase/oxidase